MLKACTARLQRIHCAGPKAFTQSAGMLQPLLVSYSSRGLFRRAYIYLLDTPCDETMRLPAKSYGDPAAVHDKFYNIINRPPSICPTTT
jgi:hypothetical protein